jgi:hypothetical protein
MEILSLVVNAFVIAAVGVLLVRGDRRTAAAIEGVRGELGGMRGELRGEVGGLRGELGELRGELRSEVGGLRGELRSEVGGLRGDLGELRSEMRASFAEVSRRIDANSARLDLLSGRIDAHIDRHAG